MLKVTKTVPKETNANRRIVAVALKKERKKQLKVEYLLPLVDSLALSLEAVLKTPQPKVRHDRLKDAAPEARINTGAMETETMIPGKNKITDAVAQETGEKIHRKILKNPLA